MSDPIKECWMCRRTEQQVRDIVPDIDRAIEEGGFFSHTSIAVPDIPICPVCELLILGVFIDNVPNVQ